MISNVQLFFNMTKKVAHTKEAPKPILDEESEPFLRTLQKKVRNINKKLTQITELEAKDNLKPEQIEKIGRKAALIEERSRIEETATLFRETYAENVAVYRAAQLKELETVARALALYHSGAKLPQSGKLASLWEVLRSNGSAQTINGAISNLSTALKTFADDKKLQKYITIFVEEHGNDKIESISVKEQKVEVVEVKPEPVKEAEVVTVVEPEAKVVTEAKVEVKEAEVTTVVQPAVVAAEVKTNPTTAETEVKVEPTTGVIPSEERPAEKVRVQGRRDDRNRGQGRPRGDRGPRGEQGGERGQYRRKDNQEPRERRQYKPKNDEREPEPKEESGSSDSEPEVRNFRKEEIRKLEDDGFIVVGKPKPKPKNPNEMRSAHDREHGKKYHHHNSNKN